MITRRDAIRWMTAAAAGAWLAPAFGDDTHSAARLARIEEFTKISDGLENKFEARSHKSDFVMPYRLFRPEATGKLPLVVYLHGSGGLGADNEKQLKLGNIFGTRVWLLPENQKKFPCYVVAPQTDRGWVRYEIDPKTHEAVGITPGLGDGSRVALEIIDALRKELPIDSQRIYIAGQSMGGAGVWNVLSGRPGFFAAALICCGSRSPDDGTASLKTAVWNFHGIDDKTVPIDVSRERMTARRKKGGHPRATEYPGVDHNSWEWAFTEPDLVKWVSAQTA
jgi:predicted peptidase